MTEKERARLDRAQRIALEAAKRKRSKRDTDKMRNLCAEQADALRERLK